MINTSDYYIKLQACNLASALVRNINDNFLSVTFDIHNSGDIQVKFNMIRLYENEIEYIDDIMLELSSKQNADIILKPIIEINCKNELNNIVYKKKLTKDI